MRYTRPDNDSNDCSPNTKPDEAGHHQSGEIPGHGSSSLLIDSISIYYVTPHWTTCSVSTEVNPAVGRRTVGATTGCSRGITTNTISR